MIACRPSRLRALPAVLALLLLAGPIASHAQDAPAAAAAGTGVVDVVALGAEDGAPLAFALVRLLADGGVAPPLRQGVTSANGRLRLADVPAGTYRLQLARIGYQPVLSPALRLAAGATVRHEFRGTTQAVQLAAVTVHGADACIGVARLDDDPRLATLWREARTGLETRRAFERQYRFVDVRRQEGTVRVRLRGTRDFARVDTLRFEPDSAEVRERRRIADVRARGSVRGGLFSLPNEKELLDPEFLGDHCLEPAAEDALVGIRFRPRAGGRDVATVRGTLWLDGRGFLTRRIDVEWVKGDEVLAEGSVAYGDVPVTGTTLRLPTGGRVVVRRVLGAARLTTTGGTVSIVDGYRDFTPVRGQ